MSCEISTKSPKIASRHQSVKIPYKQPVNLSLKQLPSISDIATFKMPAVATKPNDSSKSIIVSNSVQQILNGQKKNSLTPIVKKTKTTVAEPGQRAASTSNPEVVSECLNLTNLTSLGEQDITQITQGDILSALAFDTTGRFLSIGDYQGRCIIFTETGEGDNKNFDYYMEFQAHLKSIDYYSNQEIPDMVSNILWLSQPTKKSLLTCNAREIKLWSIKEKQPKVYTSS